MRPRCSQDDPPGRAGRRFPAGSRTVAGRAAASPALERPRLAVPGNGCRHSRVRVYTFRMELPIRRTERCRARRGRFTGWAGLTVVLIVAGAAPLAPIAAPAQDTPGAAACERVARVAVPNATIEARVVPAGSFAGPPAPFSGQDLTAVYKSLPAFCRVSATARPSPDSDIKIEVWLPVTGWNGKLLGLGNGIRSGRLATGRPTIRHAACVRRSSSGWKRALRPRRSCPPSTPATKRIVRQR